MARYVLNGAGQYVDPNNGQVLIDSYKAAGNGEFINNRGQVLNAPPSTSAIAGRQPGSLRDRVFAEAQKQTEAYQAAVQSQMDQVLSGYAERRDTAMKSLGGLGTVNIADVNSRYDALLGQTRARNNAAGMGGTPKAVGEEALIERERQAAVARARGDLADRTTSAYSQLEGDRIRAIENMNIAPPDMSTLLELARMEGEATQQGINPMAWGGGGGGGLAPAMIGGSAYGGAASMGFNIPGAANGLGGGFVGSRGGGSRRGGPSLGVLRNLKAGKLDAVYNTNNQLVGYQRATPSAQAVDPLTRNFQQQAVTDSARRATLAKMGVRNVQDPQAAVAAQKYKMTHTANQIAPNQQVPARPNVSGQTAWLSSFGAGLATQQAAMDAGYNFGRPERTYYSGDYSTPAEGARIAASRIPAGGFRGRLPTGPDPNATPRVGFGSAQAGQMPAYDNWAYVPEPAPPQMPRPFDPRDIYNAPAAPPRYTEPRYPTYAELMDALRTAQGGY